MKKMTSMLLALLLILTSAGPRNVMEKMGLSADELYRRGYVSDF